jgi:hypothetical protein
MVILKTKIRLVFVFFYLASAASFAQVSFGLKGGLNINYLLYITEGSNSTIQSNIDFHFGGYFQIPVSKKISLQPELQFSKRGDRDVDLNYIELPVLISYKLSKAFQLETGTTLAFLASFRNSFSGHEKTIDFGLTGGVRYNLYKNFFVGARYYFGLTPAESLDLNKVSQTLSPNDVRLGSGSAELNTYNRTIQFGIGYKIK